MRRGECVQDEWFLSSSALNAAIGSEPSTRSDGRVQPVVVPRVVAGLVDAVGDEFAEERVVVAAAVEDVAALVAGVVFLALLPHAAVPTANTTRTAAEIPRLMTITRGFLCPDAAISQATTSGFNVPSLNHVVVCLVTRS